MSATYRVIGRDFGEPAIDSSGVLRGLNIGDSFSASLDPALEAKLLGAELVVRVSGFVAVPAFAQGAGGSLGASQAVDFGGLVQEIWLLGTLSANLTVTFANRVAECRATLLLVQDGVGGRTLTVSDGSNTSAVVVDATAGNMSVVEVYCSNSTDLFVNP